MIINRPLFRPTGQYTVLDQAAVLKRLRIAAAIGLLLIACFMWVEIVSMPKKIIELHLFNRIFWQILPIFIIIMLSYLPNYLKFAELSICIVFLVITYANYFLIYESWVKENYLFQYESTLLYACYGFFVIGMSMKWALTFTIISVTGFVSLCMTFQMYGDRTLINVSFMITAQIIYMIALWNLNKSFKANYNANVKITSLSQTDHLTKLLNRREFEKQFNALFKLSQRPALSISVFMIDIDYFKDYNDGYGHQQGDNAIKLQSDILKHVFKRDSDLLGRYGGEEFIVAVSNITLEQTRRLAQSILDNWSEEKLPHAKGRGQEFVSCSVGFEYCLGNEYTNTEDIINLADQALYAAKNSGRACYKQARQN